MKERRSMPNTWKATTAVKVREIICKNLD